MPRFNIEEHKFKELEKYGFSRVIEHYVTRDGRVNKIIDKLYLEESYIYDDNRNTLKIVFRRVNNDWIESHPLYVLDMYESNHKTEVSVEVLDVVYDLIKDGLIVKEEKYNHNQRY